MDFIDKVAIVTGASSGIGKATAQLLSKKGAKVALVARSKEKLEKLSKKLPNSLPVVADISKVQDIKGMVKKVISHYGKIDILINNAGRGYDAPIEKIDTSLFQEIINLDYIGPIIAMQEVIPIMRKQKEGTIVNISSGTALMVLPGMGGYASLKQALAKISLTAREELKNDNIHVSVIYPYITDTNFEKNTSKYRSNKNGLQNENVDYQLPPADSPEFVAEKILEAMQKNKGEVTAHKWMKR